MHLAVARSLQILHFYRRNVFKKCESYRLRFSQASIEEVLQLRRYSVFTPANETPRTPSRKAAPGQFGFSLDPLKVAISRFSDAELDRMKREDLLDVVRFAGLDGGTSQSGSHLEFIDDQSLRRLACVARLACQRAIHSAYVEHDRVSPFIGCVALP